MGYKINSVVVAISDVRWNGIVNVGMDWELNVGIWKLRRCSKSEQAMLPFTIFDRKDKSIKKNIDIYIYILYNRIFL